MKWNKQNIYDNISVDCVIFGFEEGQLKVLLYKRGVDPFKNTWALPGGMVRVDEDIDHASQRILFDFTGVKKIYMEQMRAFGEVDRANPNKRAVTIAYSAFVKPGKFKLRVGADASDVKWFSIKNIPKMIFDHNHIFKESLKLLRKKVRNEPIGFELLDEKFTLLQLQELYETILNQSFDKPNFRKKILNLDFLIKLDEKQTNVSHRSASYYMFDRKNYNQLKEKGFLNF